MLVRVLAGVLLASAAVVYVEGHGRMIMPPSRASMWRYGFDNPKDYGDNQGFCGGTQNQWTVNGGKCGICGDPYQGPRTHEPGRDNKYANGIIVQEYQMDQVIDVTIQITAHHKGYFEFRVTPSRDNMGTVTQDDLNDNVLELESGGTRYMLPNTGSGDYDVRLRLPPSMRCDRCVLQWIYHTGNSWGCDSDGMCGSGHGAQEEFRACADISITGDGPPPTRRPSTSRATQPPTARPSTRRSTTAPKTTRRATSPPTDPWATRRPATQPPNTQPPATRPPPTQQPPVNCDQPCVWKSAGPWEGQGSIDQWCGNNCPSNTCRVWAGCKCVDPCEKVTAPPCVYRAAGAWTGMSSIDDWCRRNCPGCPSSMCGCV